MDWWREDDTVGPPVVSALSTATLCTHLAAHGSVLRDRAGEHLGIDVDSAEALVVWNAQRRKCLHVTKWTVSFVL